MMKKSLTLVMLLCVVFGFKVINADSISFSLGTLSNTDTRQINDLTYHKYVLTENENEHVIYNIEIGKYSDFDVVLHDRLYGDDAVGLSTVLEIAKDYEEKTGKVVYAAINGDYFSGGIPVDFYAKENDIYRIGPYSYTLGKNAFGFNYQHENVIGKVTYGYKLNIYNESLERTHMVPLQKTNQSLLEGEVGVFTFNNVSTITGTNIAKMSVTFDKIIGNYAYPFIGNVKTDMSTFTFSDNNYPVSYKDFVIAAKGDSQGYQTILANVSQNSKVSVYPYPNQAWDNMDFIIGGWQVLLNQGVKLPDAIHDGGYTLAPRTSIGIKSDGTIGLTVTDGRLANVPGIDLVDLANLNEDLGYETALELDGGGSSTFLLRNLETNELEIMNTPSDGSLRKVANAVLIVGDPIEDENPDDPNITTTTTSTTTTTTSQTTTSTTTYTHTQTTISTSQDENEDNPTLSYILVPVIGVIIGSVVFILKKKH